MEYKSVLITGATGKLGKLLSTRLKNCLISTPTRREMNIINNKSVSNYFQRRSFDAIIHCAAMTNGLECEKNPTLALLTNIVGTSHLVREVIEKPETRFMYMSTDYVYPCVQGPYKETDATSPFNLYAESKLVGEKCVRELPNQCIVRTSFFDPQNIQFDSAPTDVFCSKIPIGELADAVIYLLNQPFRGVINVGQNRISLYDLYKSYKPNIKPTTLDEISKRSPIRRAMDSSMDVSLWKTLSAKPEQFKNQ